MRATKAKKPVSTKVESIGSKSRVKFNGAYISSEVRERLKLIVKNNPPILQSLSDECARHDYLLAHKDDNENAPKQGLPITSLHELNALILSKFLADDPPKHGYKFRRSHAKETKDGSTSFVQYNIELPEPLATRLREKLDYYKETQYVSKSSFLFSALLWFVKYIVLPEDIEL